MKPDKAEKWLTFLFRLNAVLLTSATLTILLPNGVMQSMHQWLGLGDMPGMEPANDPNPAASPITEYLARSCSMMYAVHGIVLMVVAFNIRKYWDLVPILVGLHLALGATVLGIDLKSGMPWYWTLAEGPGIMVFAVALLWLWKQAGSASNDASAKS